MSPITLAYGWD